MQLPHTLFGLLLKGFRAGGKVCVLIAKELVGDLPCQQYPDIGVLVDIPMLARMVVMS